MRWIGGRTWALSAIAAAALVLGAGCRRRPGASSNPDAGSALVETPDVRCVERPEGCVWCQGRGVAPALLDTEDTRPVVCDPKDDENCIEFCSWLTPDCALPWRGSSCLAPSEEAFRRALFWRDNADRPEAVLIGRVVDEAGRRIEGAKVRVWYTGTPVGEQISGKDGVFRLALRAGPWKYAVRVTHPGLASEIAEVALPPPDRPERPAGPHRLFRMSPESQVRGRVLDGAGDPVKGVTVHALRTPEDVIEAGEARSGDDGSFVLGGVEAGKRYYLRASHFGWETAMLKAAVTPPAARVALKLVATGVIRGVIVDADDEAEPNATVVALPSGPLGAANSPILRWTADADGRFAEDRFALGTYYLWARRGEMLVYPPAKVEITEEDRQPEVKLELRHRGARVSGRVVPRTGFNLREEARVILRSRSPLAFPRDAIGDVAPDGRFVVAGMLPGRYEISVRSATKSLGITRGPREVEVPIEAGITVELGEPIAVRPQPED